MPYSQKERMNAAGVPFQLAYLKRMFETEEEIKEAFLAEDLKELGRDTRTEVNFVTNPRFDRGDNLIPLYYGWQRLAATEKGNEVWTNRKIKLTIKP